jgi:hypothetical protein
MDICKCEFERAYNKYAPTKLELFYLKRFSSNSNKLAISATSIMLIPFLLGFVTSSLLTSFFSGLFAFILIIFGVAWIYVWLSGKRRVKKIMNELNITEEEYDNLIIQLYVDPSINAFLKNKVCK